MSFQEAEAALRLQSAALNAATDAIVITDPGTSLTRIKEPAAMLGARQHALVEAAEHAVAMARDQVVAPVEHATWQGPKQTSGLPRPAQQGRDK